MRTTLTRFGYVVLTAVLAVSASADQTVRLNGIMRDKLVHAQKILEAVVTSDWVMLEEQSRALRQLTDDQAWTVLETPEYARHTLAFSRAAQDLIEAAHRHDLETTPLAYVGLTLSCVQCHRYVARSRIANDH